MLFGIPPMLSKASRSVTSLLALYCLVASVATALRAQPYKDKPVGEVDVAAVKFSSVRGPGGLTTWYEAELELHAKPASDSNRFVNRVRVVLNLGIEVSAAGAKRVDFYRAEAEAVALEGGKNTVRFFLPPEVVKRDSVRGDAKYYLVEVAIGGQAVPLARSHVSATSLPNPEAVNSFKSKIAAEAALNDGVLQPQYLTPFIFDSTRPAPTFVRKENAR